ncbi:MAG: helix-turn-helix domain-containing protein [Sedimenticola sp.]
MPHTGKGLYAKYDRGLIEKAVAAVRGGLSLRQASKKYGIPRSTISDRVTGKVADGSSLGRKPTFPVEVEKEIAETAKTAADKGIGLSKSQLLVRAGKLATRLNIKTPFKGTPGHGWWQGFKNRNVGITLRQPEPLSNNRSRMMNPIVVGRYMVELKTIITQHNLDANTIWNCDETGINMQHKPVKVCARVGAKNVPGRVGNTRTQVTLLPCINAAGECMPPMLVVKGKTKRSLSAYNVGEGPTDAIWTYQSKAWMDDILGVSWFEEVFLTHCGTKRPQLLILDSHHSHETVEILEKAQENNIMVLALPPHTTHYLCPLDRAVFGPLQRHYNTVCSEHMAEDLTNVIDKQSLPKMIKRSYDAAFSRCNIVAGFESTGIYHWDPLKIPVVAFAPSSCSEESRVEYAEKQLVHADDMHPLQWVFRALPPTTGPVIEPMEQATLAEIVSVSTQSTQHDEYIELPPTTEPATEPMEQAAVAEIVSIGTESTQHDDYINFGTIMESILPSNDGAVLLPEDTMITLVSTEEQSFLSESNMWNAELQSIFQPTPSPILTEPKPVQKGKKYITSHRLLTSESIINSKQNDKQHKLKVEAEKKQRKDDKEMKRKLKNSQK